MSRDPAVNWYFDNWGGGTKTMSRFLKGCYMDLLDAQFHSGHLSIDEIKHVLGADFSAWQTLQKKFQQDVHGNYFNERLDHEISKRVKNSKQQSEKVKKRWDIYHGIYNGTTEVIPNNETEIGTGIGSFGKGMEKPFGESETDIDLLKEKVFADKAFCEQFLVNGLSKEYLYGWLENFNKYLKYSGTTHKTEKDYRFYFPNWVNEKNIFDDPANYEVIRRKPKQTGKKFIN